MIPMFFTYCYIFLVLWFALVYAHSLRIGYVSQFGNKTVKAALVAICCFYPSALVVCVVFVALLPLNSVLALFTKRTYSLEVPPHEKDESGALQLVIEESERVKFSVEANMDDSLYDLKLTVIEGLGRMQLEPTDIFLVYQEEMLLNDSLRLEEYKIESGSSLQLLTASKSEQEDRILEKICERFRACRDKIAECCRYLGVCCCLVLSRICCCICSYRAKRLYIDEGAVYRLDGATSFEPSDKLSSVGKELMSTRGAILRARAQGLDAGGGRPAETGKARPREDAGRAAAPYRDLADLEAEIISSIRAELREERIDTLKERISKRKRAAISYIRDMLRNVSKSGNYEQSTCCDCR